ncbi:DNA mismatch repair endonuclease MutL [Phocicoccus pinnipedialis]|uniref:DNA mismatch repair protein MutL n=1 Tax=Phocicoccus pinnipedialis TaxID=110845 RepID=A0A6V7RHE3_9BACL|nr:DNA mismatch repair endonuclease MutL [Jeotgalicoccus pinnipedialis]MBP1939145.1 DNA mismatch repair protein MutL [Jeotgalicoccus pinnipedialis]CAD2076597.1 DNA mismatch repair protein MutL [Jeotgalicoccus pinnipedialis]
MTNIHILDPIIQNKIAAGEVVERPSSIVKELVENSIDANASYIEVFIEESGMKSIKIIDDGDGILIDDAPLLFERHATSKIESDYDLFTIRTMGFRGEALASISAVSRTIVKSYNESSEPFMIEMYGGEEVVRQPSSERKGTEVIVKDLFFNTPARYKYVSSLTTEAGKIIDVMQKFSFNHPNISFKLTFDNKQRFATKGNGNLKEIIADIYGLNTARIALEVDAKSPDYHLTGYIIRPEMTRSNRNYINISINNRMIRDYRLTNSVVRAYHTLLAKDKYPIVILNVDMDPKIVDVNVHPAKTEVRISKIKELESLIEETVKSILHGETLIPDSIEHTTFQTAKFEKPRNEQESIDFSSITDVINQRTQTVKNQLKQNFQKENKSFRDNNLSYDNKNDEKEVPPNISNVNETSSGVFNDVTQEETQRVKKERLPYFEIIGQFHGTYILMQNETGLFLMDQHAAQERIKYEYYYSHIKNRDNKVPLLLPYTFEFAYDDVIKIDEKLTDLRNLSFNIEKTGMKNYTVVEYPSWINAKDPEGDIRAVIDFISNTDRFSVEDYKEEMSIMMSCKDSIKANHYLDKRQMQNLLDELAQCQSPFTCPHGRPIIIHFTTYEIERMFNRIMK